MVLPAALNPWHIRGLQLRQLTGEADKAQLQAVQSAVMPALENPRWYFPAEDWEFDAWLERREAVGYFHEGTLVGFAVLSAWSARGGHGYAHMLGEPEENTFDFHDVMVLPQWRGRGIHTRFLSLFAEMARAMDGRAIYATVDPENSASWHNFEKAGYENVCERPAYDGRPRRFYRLTLR